MPEEAILSSRPMLSALHPSLENIIRMNPGESVLRLFRATSFGDPRAKNSENASKYSGLMLITDQRLVFIVESGVFQKKYSLGETIELDAIQMVDVEGFLDKCLVVRYLRYNLNYPSGFDDFMEVDPVSLKGTTKVPLVHAQQALNDALARRRGQPFGI